MPDASYLVCGGSQPSAAPVSLGLSNRRWLGPVPRGSDSVGLGWGLRICIFDKSLLMLAGTATLGNTL